MAETNFFFIMQMDLLKRIHESVTLMDMAEPKKAIAPSSTVLSVKGLLYIWNSSRVINVEIKDAVDSEKSPSFGS